MESSDSERKYLSDVKVLTSGNRRLEELFATIPVMSTIEYQKTAYLYANRKYENELNKNEPVPHGFYQILEDSIISKGFLPTLRVYGKELSLISETLKIDEVELRTILKELRPKPKKGVHEIQEEQKARQKLKQIFRKFNSVYKENYVKRIVEDKIALLQESIIPSEGKKVKKVLPPKSFVKNIFDNQVLLNRVRNLILQKFYLYPSDSMLTSILLMTTKKSYLADMVKMLNITKPDAYEMYLAERHIRRLDINFTNKLNAMAEDFSLEEKEMVIKIINYLEKCYSLSIPHNDDTFNEMKMMIKKVHIKLLQDISRLMLKSGTKIVLEDGNFKFVFPPRIDEVSKEECKRYQLMLKSIKSLHNKLYNLYVKQNEVLLDFINEADTNIPDDDLSVIDTSKWLDISKIEELISKIDIDALNKMSDKVFNALKKFVIKDGLLWVYLAGNIDVNMISKIINNFASIYVSMGSNAINISNIQEVVKKANLYDYVDDFTIALIGLDNLAKIINYNQFLGVNVTDEIIRKRIRKVVDLALRSEEVKTSSLPFTCDIKTNNYSLIRYLNNDPAIFTSGIDTKTCFCVGVNENDFFFYSLLNKDGYVLKIVDRNNKLVARAACFRRNNVFMINGIRLLNNKVIPESQEDLQQFKDIVELIKLMAKKMIAITSDDKCPIDYVVCNQAGLLENSYFEDTFEKVNSQLFREPINVYSDEWKEFVHIYDNCEEQMLQEVDTDPEHSFTTDFGNHYPALLIESRNNMGLFSPRDISLSDQEAVYKRPRKRVLEFIGEEIDEKILFRINRLRALDYNRRKMLNEKMAPFVLISNTTNIDKVWLGEDWCIIAYSNGKKVLFCSNMNRELYIEINRYGQVARSKEEKDVKLYNFYDERRKK